MNNMQQPEPTVHPAPAPEMIVVCSGPAELLADCSLVLSAVGIAHHMDPAQQRILVRQEDGDAAVDHLQAYRQENKNWPPLPDPASSRQQATDQPTLLAIGGLAVFFLLTGPWTKTNPWFQIGAIDSHAILAEGQWWRLVTALTLHTDPVHLLGNCIIGGFMVHLLCSTTGYGTGWILLLLTGSTGNLLNIAFRGMEHRSVGFSTAVFASIGILSGLQIGTRRSTMLKQLLLSLGAGAGLLAFLGTEGQRTDLGAHLFGFFVGILAGILVRFTDLTGQATNQRLQLPLFLMALTIVVCCWLLA